MHIFAELFLDDIRTPNAVYSSPYDGGWTIVRGYEEFVNAIQKYGVPDIISFDHDLEIEHYGGNFSMGANRL